MYTKEQQEAMAACLREYHDSIPVQSMHAAQLYKHGIRQDDGTLATWLQPPDDSVAMDHPLRVLGHKLFLGSVDGQYEYWQGVNCRFGGTVSIYSGKFPTEEAARVAWNKLCREAS